MPHGPGIHDADRLIGELAIEGWLKIRDVNFHDHTALQFTLTEKARDALSDLSNEAITAIRYGVQQVQGKTAGRVSQDSHEQSRAWQEGSNGRELAIYTDMMTDQEYADLKTQTELAAKGFSEITRTSG